MSKEYIKKESGYTIIETMIAVSLFIVIVMAGMEALLNANALNQKSQNMRSILDNLSFVMEDMSRNLRTGYEYHCITDGNPNEVGALSCPSGNGGGVSFKSAPPTSQWVYYISNGKIFKSTDGLATTPIQLTPDEVIIDPASSFKVTGAEPPLGDTKQPFVTIKLVGTINIKGVTRFSLQTSVSQRQIDNTPAP